MALAPEIHSLSGSDGVRVWNSLDLVVTINAVKLHLYDDEAFSEADLKDHGIARFALNSNTLRGKILSDGAMEMQLVLKSFTMSNTCPGNSKFREIIPAATHDRNQVMILYTVSSGQDTGSCAVVTVDSPQIVFSVEPVIALLSFFMSAFSNDAPPEEHLDETIQVQSGTAEAPPEAPPEGPSISLRLDLHDVSVVVLENEADAQSQAIRLGIKRISISQQVC